MHFPSQLRPAAAARDGRSNRAIECLLAAGLLCGTAAACAQSPSTMTASAQTIFKHVDSDGRTRFTDRPETAAVESPAAAHAAQAEPGSAAAEKPEVQVIRIRNPRPGKVDKKEAARRLQQAERALARRAGAFRGDPPMTVGSPTERQQAIMEKLRRDLAAAQARAREVYGAEYGTESTTSAALLAVLDREGMAQTR